MINYNEMSSYDDYTIVIYDDDRTTIQLQHEYDTVCDRITVRL